MQRTWATGFQTLPQLPNQSVLRAIVGASAAIETAEETHTIMAASKKVLTEAEWVEVFKARCRSKRGERLTNKERDLVEAAFRSDEKNGEMELDVFDTTVPFGSSARARR